MEFFKKAKAVRLRSHMNKYLVADDDHVTTRQSRSGATRKARWLVEGSDDIIRLKSCYGTYLAASDEPFLLGMTGHKVRQTSPDNINALAVEWRPVRDGFQVKLMAFSGTFLRANGGTPPWRNTITHDSPHAGSTRNWIVWDVEAVDVPENEGLTDYLSMVSSFSSVSDELSGLGSPISVYSGYSPSPARWSAKENCLSLITRTPAMDLFQNTSTVRLRSVHNRYLVADNDEESVTQHRNGSSRNAKWTVELVENADNIIRLRSCYNKYLTASNSAYLLGMTGKKVVQARPPRLDSSVEWEPLRQGGRVRLKTRYGQFLRANGGVPPWKNSVTHDIPYRSTTRDWVLWEVDVVEMPVVGESSPVAKVAPGLVPSDSFASDSSSPSTTHSSNSASFSGHESNDSLASSSSPKARDGRMIYFHVADEYGDIDEAFAELSITFKGNSVQELTKRLEEELDIAGIVVCTKSPLNGKLYPLRLQLPPNNGTMHVVVVPTSPQDQDSLKKRLVERV